MASSPVVTLGQSPHPPTAEAARAAETRLLGLSLRTARTPTLREMGDDAAMLVPAGVTIPASGRPAIYVLITRVQPEMLNAIGRAGALQSMKGTYMATTRAGTPAQRSFRTGPVSGERVTTSIPSSAEFECYLVDVPSVGTVFVGMAHATATPAADAEAFFREVAVSLAASGR